jgi:hypothetical protein
MRTELMVLLHMIAGELASLEDSVELRNAHANLLNIRRRLARPALTGAEIAVPRSVDGRHHSSTAEPAIASRRTAASVHPLVRYNSLQWRRERVWRCLGSQQTTNGIVAMSRDKTQP